MSQVGQFGKTVNVMKKSEFEANKQVIMTCRLFKDMTEDEVYKLLKKDGNRIITANAGEDLFFDAAYVVLGGSICIEKKAADSRPLIMSRATSPAPINLAVAFSHDDSLSRLYAETDSRLLMIDGSVIRDGIKAGGTFALNVTEFLVDRVGFLNRKITTFAGYSAESRLNLYLAENMKDGKVEIKGTLTDLAKFLGVGRASLYRSLDDLEERNIIKRKGRMIEITGEL